MTGTSSPTATTPADPFAVPKVIDAAYANRVLEALNLVDGDALRLIVSTRAIDIPVLERIRAIYNDPEYDVELRGSKRVLEGDLAVFKTPPGNLRTEVERVLVARPDCIVVEARLDNSAVLHTPPSRPADELQVIVLVPTQPGADLKRLNPTPWSVRYDELIRAGQTAQDASCGE